MVKRKLMIQLGCRKKWSVSVSRINHLHAEAEGLIDLLTSYKSQYSARILFNPQSINCCGPATVSLIQFLERVCRRQV